MSIDHTIEILRTIEKKGAIPMQDLYIHLNFLGMGMSDFNDCIKALDDMDIISINAQGYVKESFNAKNAKKLLINGDFI
jgi:hypothetical protein